MKSNFRHFPLISGFALVLSVWATPSLAADPSTQFALGGYVNTGSPSNFDLTALENYALAHPDQVKTVSVAKAGGGSDVYTGISLSGFLDSYVVKPAGPSAPKNDVLRDYVVATGSDGYKSVFSLGELNSGFGNQNDIIAYELNGSVLSSDGFARIIAPGDAAKGRWVFNLASLQIGHADFTPGTGGISSNFTLNGAVANPATFSLTDLPGSLPATTVTVNSQSGDGKLPGTTFTGVSLWDLLNQAGILTDPTIKNDILGKYVVATGSDGYAAVFSLGELDPKFGNQPDLVAYANALGTTLGSDGFARIVVPDDVKGGRYVSNLTSLTVYSVAAVPLPGSAIFMFSSVAGFFLNGYRKLLTRRS